MNKRKISTIVLSIIVLLAMVGYFVVGNPTVFMNNQKLDNSLNSITGDTVKLNEVVPFEWDAVYTFESYISKGDMEKIIGFQSSGLEENHISEGMVHLVFVDDEKVVSSKLGYSSDLGYSLDFDSKVVFSENAEFKVVISDGVVKLTHIK